MGRRLENHPAARTAPELVRSAQEVLRHSISERTRYIYETQVRRFWKWCQRHDVSVYTPPTDETIALYIIDRSRNVKISTIRSEISAIHFWMRGDFGEGGVKKSSDILDRVWRGLKRDHGTRSVSKLAVTVDMVEQFAESRFDEVVLKAISIFGIYGLLRISELLPLQRRSETYHCWGDWSWNKDELRLFLAKSKTDISNRGVEIRYAPNGSKTCPVRWYRRLRKMYSMDTNDSTSPVFVREDGSLFIQSDLRSYIKTNVSRLGYDCDKYSGHSLRRGGASALAKVGAPAHLLKSMGRWTSECYMRYIDIDQSVIRHYSRLLGDQTGCTEDY